MKDHPIIKIDVRSINLAPWNYKKEDADLSTKLMTSLDRSGYSSKIIVAKIEEEKESDEYEVIDGNHRVMALRLCGIKEVNAVYVGRLPIIERKRIGMELNELKFKSDDQKMDEILKDILKETTATKLSTTMPFTEKELTALLDMKGTEKEPQKQDEEWVRFSFGMITGSIPKVIFDRFCEAIEILKKQTVLDLPHQVEYIIEAFHQDQK